MSKIKKIKNPYSIFHKDNLWKSYAFIEGELAKAQAEVGIIPKKAAINILKNTNLSDKEIKNIEESNKKTKRLILSIVQELAKKCDEQSAGLIHLGGTTRNVLDAGRNLIIRDAHRLILNSLCYSLRKLSQFSNLYAETPMLGRTMGQNAIPITFGFKVSGWIESLIRLDKKFKDAESSIFTLNFGGAVGAMHGFDGKGEALTKQLSKNLGFKNSLVPNRTSIENSIDYLLSLSFQGIVIGKIANEIYDLMSQSINEVSEKQTKGQIGSSTMPHKVNPFLILDVIKESALLRGKTSISIEAGIPSHEGDARYDKIIDELLKETVLISLNLFENFNNLLDNLNIKTKQMHKNLVSEKDYIASENLMYKLSKHIGRQKAHDLIHLEIEKTVLKNQSVKENLIKEKTISRYFKPSDIEKIMDPLLYIGESKKISLKLSNLALNYATDIEKRINKKDLGVR